VLRKTIEGFHDFAKICSFHKLDDEFNKLIATLSKSLFKFAELSAAQPERIEEPHWVFVSVFPFFLLVLVSKTDYGVASIGRLLKIIGLFCKRAL